VVIGLVWLAAFVTLWYLHRRHRFEHDYHNDLLALGVLALATAGFFWRLLFTPGVWMPAGGGDLVSFLFPLFKFAARSLESGHLPLWNPYLYGGAPFVADNQSGLLYPINLAVFLFGSRLDYRTMELLAVVHYWLAGACAYVGLRYIERRPLKRWAALAGAAAFMFSDLFVTHFGNLNMIACAAWLPLVFCLFRRALDETRVPWAATAGLFLGIAALAGHIQPLLFMAVALCLYLLVHVLEGRSRGWRHVAASAAIFAVTVVIAVGVAAPALFPAFEMSRSSLRANLTYQEASQYSLPPVALVGLIVPAIFGRGPRSFWGSWPRVEVGYVGVLTLLLAALALLLRRDRLTRFFLFLGVLSLFLALGNATFLHGWLFRFVPGFNLVRAPARFVYLLDFALASLAALGLDTLLRPLPVSMRPMWARVLRFSPVALIAIALGTVPIAFAVVLQSQDKAPEAFSRMLNGAGGVLFALAMAACGLTIAFGRQRHWLSRSGVGLLAVVVIVFDLAIQGASTELEFNDPTSGFEHQEAIGFLKSDPDYFRIDTRTEVWDAWQPDLSLMHGIFDVWGIYNPLVLADYNRYWEGLGSRSTRLYDFLNTKYVVAHKDVVLDWSKFELAFAGDPQVNIYRNNLVLPRAYVVHNVWPVSGSEQAFAAIHRAEFDPASTVVIEGGIAPATGASGSSEVRITSYTNDEIRMEASSTAPGYLVTSEVYYPGWRVQVDGRPAELARANYAFRAVWLPPGTHQIRFWFEPSSWRLGLLCCLLAWLGLAAIALAVPIRGLVRSWRYRGGRQETGGVG